MIFVMVEREREREREGEGEGEGEGEISRRIVYDKKFNVTRLIKL